MSTNVTSINEIKTAAQGLLILSHSRARAFNPRKFTDGKVTMIRVEDPETPFKPLVFASNFAAVSTYKFHDADSNKDNQYQLISIKDAKHIVDFFVKHKDTKLMVVHCHAGIARSSAIGAAWAKYIGDSELEKYIFSCGQYVPNRLVYSAILKELNHREISVEPVLAK